MHQVHQRFSDSLAKVEQRLADPKGGPILVLAHSLGGVVVTNYLWNLERVTGEVGTANAGATADGSRALARQAFGVTPAQKLETLAGLVTFGCNIPLFLPPTLPYECVRFPRRDLPEHLKAVARWLNVYDPFDVLGYPLNNLWDANFRHGTTIDDVPLAVGPFPISRTPLSHNYYWTDRGFQAMVAGQIRDVLRAARGSA
jgi:pimeloyl-ACP methyl ester carboxylesterase